MGNRSLIQKLIKIWLKKAKLHQFSIYFSEIKTVISPPRVPLWTAHRARTRPSTRRVRRCTSRRRRRPELPPVWPTSTTAAVPAPCRLRCPRRTTAHRRRRPTRWSWTPPLRGRGWAAAAAMAAAAVATLVRFPSHRTSTYQMHTIFLLLCRLLYLLGLNEKSPPENRPSLRRFDKRRTRPG